MDDTMLYVIMALLPFAVLFIGFIAFKADALKLSLIVWVLELATCAFVYHMDVIRLIESSLWGNLTLWTGFLVLWTGQVFGSCYRSTGLLNILLNTLGKIMPTKEGKSLTLVTVVAGYLGAFNGFATYPVTIPGLKKLGFSGVRSAAAYLVYFSWNIAFVSLFVAANIAAGVSKIPIEQIIQVMGLIAMPLCIVSTIGFFAILKFDLKNKDNIAIAVLTMIGNMLAVFIFTQAFPSLYLLTLIASATFCLVALKIYSKKYSGAVTEDEGEQHSTKEIFKAFGPLICCMILVILMTYPLADVVKAATFSISLWGYAPTSVSLLNAPGAFVLITAILCYLFAAKKTSSFKKDVATASKRALPSLLTLLCGGAMVQLMMDTNQISLLATSMATLGGQVYTALVGGLSFLCGMAFGQGMPAVRMLASMQMSAGPVLGIAPVVLIGLASVVCMGTANPIKPSLLKYASSLADVKGEDGRLFNLCLPWQLVAFVVCALLGVLLVATGYVPVPLL